MKIIDKCMEILTGYLDKSFERFILLYHSLFKCNIKEIFNLICLKDGDYSEDSFIVYTFLITVCLMFLNPFIILTLPLLGKKKIFDYHITVSIFTLLSLIAFSVHLSLLILMPLSFFTIFYLFKAGRLDVKEMD